MTHAQILTDRAALERNRRRAKASPVTFLREAVVDETLERLSEVNRTFTRPAIVTVWPELWADHLPDAVFVPDDDLLALDEQAFDLVIHDLSLHWANDPVGQLVQCRRALQPDGLMIATLFGGLTLNEMRTSLAQAEITVAGGLSPRVTPMGEIRDLGALLQRAGLALPVADASPFNVSYAALTNLMQDLRHMGEANALAARLRKVTPRALFAVADRIYRDTFGTDDGRIPATFEVVTLTGWAPSETQQKPLRPGSAQVGLADVLGVAEGSLDGSED